MSGPVWSGNSYAQSGRALVAKVLLSNLYTVVQGLIWGSLKAVYKEGVVEFLLNLWNLTDIMSYGAFMGWIGLRSISFLWVHKLQYDGLPEDEIWIPRHDGKNLVK